MDTNDLSGSSRRQDLADGLRRGQQQDQRKGLRRFDGFPASLRASVLKGIGSSLFSSSYPHER